MFLVRVIVLSRIVLTVYTSPRVCGGSDCSHKCCGENMDECKADCTGIVCTRNSQCGDQCCIGAITYFIKGYCGACHKTRSCQFFFSGHFCREKCCGSDSSHLKCLKTCAGISCKSNSDCDGECCMYGSCSPKRHVRSCLSTDKCSRNLDCATNCCKFGKCSSKYLCPSTIYTPRPWTTPVWTTPVWTRPCKQDLDCTSSNCCRYGTCWPREHCPYTTDTPTSPQPGMTAVWITDGHCRQDRDCSTSNCCRYGTCWSREHCPYTADRPSTTSLATTKRCIRNLDCATGCCVRGQCFSQQKCQSTVSPQAESSSVDLKKAIIIPIAGIVFLVILGVSIYCCLNRRRKSASLVTSQTTSHVLLTSSQTSNCSSLAAKGSTTQGQRLVDQTSAAHAKPLFEFLR